MGLALCLGVSATATCHSYPSRASWALLTRCASVLKSLAVSGFILPVARVAQRIVLARGGVWYSGVGCLVKLPLSLLSSVSRRWWVGEPVSWF